MPIIMSRFLVVYPKALKNARSRNENTVFDGQGLFSHKIAQKPKNRKNNNKINILLQMVSKILVSWILYVFSTVALKLRLINFPTQKNNKQKYFLCSKASGNRLSRYFRCGIFFRNS